MVEEIKIKNLKNSSGTCFQTLFFRMMKKAYHMLNMMLLIYLVILVQFSGCINISLFKVDSALGNSEICLVHYGNSRIVYCDSVLVFSSLSLRHMSHFTLVLRLLTLSRYIFASDCVA